MVFTVAFSRSVITKLLCDQTCDQLSVRPSWAVLSTIVSLGEIWAESEESVSQRYRFREPMAICCVLLATACAAPPSLREDVPATPPDAQVAVTSLDERKRVKADEKLDITAVAPWRIHRVRIVGDKVSLDAPIAAASSWTSEPIAPRQTVTLQATLSNPQSNQEHLIERTVSVGKALSTFSASLFPQSGSFGVGVIPTITFSQPVARKDRAKVLSHVRVDAQPTPVTGSWRWISDSVAAFRPPEFWPGHRKISISADMSRVRLNKVQGLPAAWGTDDVRSRWATGPAMIVRLNAKALSGQVTIDGERKRSFPISLGKPGFTTRSGTKTLTIKYRVKRMTNIGITDDEVYDLQVPYAMQMTDSGEFLHGAPWNGNIGYAHTSHGCSNLQLDDARWIYNRMRWGDPVVTTGTGRPMENWNGPGAMWNIPAAKWADESA